MQRKCILCEKDFVVEPDEIQFLVKNKLVHPFLVCKKCSMKELSELTRDSQDSLIERLGTPEGREKEWTTLVEDHPEIRAAHVVNELDL